MRREPEIRDQRSVARLTPDTQCWRENGMKLMPPEIVKDIPALYATEHLPLS